MTKELYDTIKKSVYQFGGEQYTCGQFATWALWGTENPEEYIDKNVDKLNPHIVFVFPNWAGPDGQINQNARKGPTWFNFHNTGRMDTRIRNVLQGSRYEGAYMTDLVKYPTRDVKDLDTAIQAGQIDMEKQAQAFINEIAALDTATIELYLVGGCTKKLFKKYVKTSRDFHVIKNKITGGDGKCIVHPAPKAIWNDTTFYRRIGEQLGINLSRYYANTGETAPQENGKALEKPPEQENKSGTKKTGDYEIFYTRVCEKIQDKIPLCPDTPSNNYWLSIPTNISNIHFEWVFRGKEGSFCVETHFEKSSKPKNQEYYDKVIKLKSELEKATGETIVERSDLSKPRFYIEHRPGTINDGLVTWAVEKMINFIDIINKKL